MVNRIARAAQSLAFHGVRQWCAWRPMRLRPLPPGRAFVSFTFDDFPGSSVDTGAKILEDYGGRGTFYASMSKFDRPGSFTREHLRRLLEQGHELACHTFDHIDCMTSTHRRIDADLEANAVAVRDVVGDIELSNFAFPYGSLRPDNRRFLGRRFESLRTIYPGVHRIDVDLCALHGNEIKRDTPIERPLELLRRVARGHGWLVLFTHEVDPEPTPWGTTPAVFEQLVRTAHELELELLPVRDVIAELEDPD